MNTQLRKKNDFEKYFFKFINNAIFAKAIENVRKYSDIKLATTKLRRNYFMSAPNYHTTKTFS